jgi:hypothetical protein
MEKFNRFVHVKKMNEVILELNKKMNKVELNRLLNNVRGKTASHPYSIGQQIINQVINFIIIMSVNVLIN